MSSPETRFVPRLEALPQVSERVLRDAERYRGSFLSADPFKHVAIEGFFEPAFAERLLEEFPSFDPQLARNEFGRTGGKAVNTKIREISPAYRELYATISSQPFLDLVSCLSGIPDLILDPKMYGGGTHDNRHGQELDAHVDFNYDEEQQLHRRLNLIVYLNKGWKTEWGGAIEIHSNPRDPAANRIYSFNPLFNRCVLFETNERSWHGFPRIDLPPDERHRSRKSISIYLYTKDRPAEEIAPVHGTFYIQRPLPTHIQPGRTLSGADVAEIKNLLKRRDDWIESYHKMELEKNREIAAKSQDIRHMMSRVDSEIEERSRAVRELTREIDSREQTIREVMDHHTREVESKDQEIRNLVSHYEREMESRDRTIRDFATHGRPVLTGYAIQGEATEGIFSDGWVASHAVIEIQPLVPVSRLVLRGWRPDDAPPGKIRVSAGNIKVETPVGSGSFQVALRLPSPATETFQLNIDWESQGRTVDSAVDTRDLAFQLAELRVIHPALPLWKKMLGSR